MKHPIEADDSWNAYLDRHGGGSIDDVDDEEGRTTTIAAEEEPSSSYRRRLSKPKAEKDDNKQQHDKHRHHSIDDDDDEIDPIQLEKLKFAEDLRTQQVQQASQSKKQSKAEKKRLEAYNAVYQSPGIARTSVHGLMVRSVHLMLSPSIECSIMTCIAHHMSLTLHFAITPTSTLYLSRVLCLVHSIIFLIIDRCRLHRITYARLRIRTTCIE
jgi:hypothetical protein